MKTATESSGHSFKEYDEVYADDLLDVSVGTSIKVKAAEYHRKLLVGIKLTNEEYACMTTGLSSILDFSNSSNHAQKMLFSSRDWKLLLEKYTLMYPTEEGFLDAEVIKHWDIVVQVVLDNRDVIAGLSYLYKIFPKQMKKDFFFCFKILEHILNLVGTYEDILVEGSSCTENDYIRIVWPEIFEQLFKPSSNIRVVTGETVSNYSTLGRQEQYSTTGDEAKQVVGFKIDIRLVYNKSVPGCSEIDLCAGEVAKKEDKAKTMNDRSKVSREAKDNLDHLATIFPSSLSKYCVGWSLLITGSTCSICCLYLTANGLYVNIPKSDFSLPSNFLELSTASDVLKNLLELRREVFFLADLLQAEMSRPPSVTRSLGRSKEKQPFSEKILWRRDTYYPSSYEFKSVPPKYLFGFPSNKAIVQMLGTFDGASSYTLHHNEKTNESCDKYGWMKVEGGWYNTKTKCHSKASLYI